MGFALIEIKCLFTIMTDKGVQFPRKPNWFCKGRLSYVICFLSVCLGFLGH